MASNARHRRMTDFDPWDFNPGLRWMRDWPSKAVAITFLGMAGLLVLGTRLEGTFGSMHDFQLGDDLKRIAGLSGPTASAPSFPLVRDVASWILFLTIMFGGLVMHRQWRLMSTCLGELVDNGALVVNTDEEKLPEARSFKARILGLRKVLEQGAPNVSIDSFVHGRMEWLRKKQGWFGVTLGLTAFVFAALLIIGEQRGLFQTFAPRDLTPAARQTWLDDSYASWWAGNHHVFGYISYFVLAFIAFFIILSINTVGVVSVHLLIGLRAITRSNADWLNRDLHFGWVPIARVYRSVLWCVAILSLALTVTIAVLGLDNVKWISVVLVVYALTVPIFIVVPRLLFRKAEHEARRGRVDQVVRAIALKGLRVDRDFDQLDPFLAELERVRLARIKPFRIRTISFSTLIFVYILPILLGVAQIVFPLSFGSR